MNINQLNYFISVAESRSFSMAAEKHYINQAAVTQQIKALEDALGCQLVNRKTRPVSLTQAGEVLLIEARALLERLQTAVDRTREASTGIVGNLHIGYLRGYERSSLSDYLRAYHQKYPNVMVSCYRNSTDRLEAGLIGGKYDMIITWDSTNLYKNEEIASFELEKARLVCALYSRHPLARGSSVDRISLKGERLLYLSPSETKGTIGDGFYMDLYRKSGYVPNIIFHSSDAESILMMVAAEEGISILPDYMTSKLDNAEGIVFIPMNGCDEYEKISVLWKKESNNAALIQMIKELHNKASV
ncbi:MAG: LysR family transcriptional regulator [Clostridiales bacterium]|nr:LysR family transcriptional regulator [Clostridiales bacterium]